MTLGRYSKSIVAFLGAAATWAAAALDDNKVSNAEWAALAAAVFGVLAVYQVRNTPAPTDESGHADVLLLVAILVGVLLLLCGVTLR
jgi:hypothetical protein